MVLPRMGTALCLAILESFLWSRCCLLTEGPLCQSCQREVRASKKAGNGFR